jgi:SAM-dependent methyltransferase
MSNDRYTGDKVLRIFSKHAINRNNFIEKLIVKHLGLDNTDETLRVLDFGAGKGEFLLRFVGRKNLKLVSTDSDEEYRKNLSAISEVYDSIRDVPGELDAIYLIDVLEHIEDDRELLGEFYKKLKSGGKLFIYVPARIELYSAFDKKIGHYRRYSKSELKEKVLKAGFKISLIKYHEFLVYCFLRLLKLFGAHDKVTEFNVRVYDRFFVPACNYMEKVTPAPVGKSLYLVAEKN